MAKINKIKDSVDAVIILPDIRSAINVGAIFRIADTVGIKKVFLVGYTPRPTDQFGRIQKDIAKSALGAETLVEWEYKKTITPLIKNLKNVGYEIIGIEQDKNAIDYRTYKAKRNIAFVLGREVEGLSQKIKNHCDVLLEIPLYGQKESLNVSIAAGVALFRVLHP